MQRISDQDFMKAIERGAWQVVVTANALDAVAAAFTRLGQQMQDTVDRLQRFHVVMEEELRRIATTPHHAE